MAYTGNLGSENSRLANIRLGAPPGSDAIDGDVAPSLLGGAVVFAPRVDQEVRPGLLGPAVLNSIIVTGHVRVTQRPVEVAYTPSGRQIRVTQRVVEVAYRHNGVFPALLGPAQLFSPTFAQAAVVTPGVLGPASLFTPTVGPPGILPALLGPATLFTPLVGPPGVLPGILGPAVLFSPTIAGDAVAIPLLGPAVLFTPSFSQDLSLSGSDTGTGADTATTDTARTTADSGAGLDDAFTDSPGSSDSAVGTDSASVVKLGDSLCGPYSGPVTITYDGVDITSCVLYQNTVFRSSANASPGTAEVRIKDAGQNLSFTTGRPLTLTVNGVREWTGFVTSVSRGYFFNGTPYSPGDTTRYFLLAGVDLNVLFQKRILYDKAHPGTQIELTNFPPGTDDDVIIKYYMDNHMDLAGDGISQAGIEPVGTPSIDSNIGRAASETWGEFVRAMRFLTGAIDYIDPDGVYQHVDVDTPTAPFDVTDDPAGGPEHGVRDLEIEHNGEKLRNDAMIWGAGQGNDVVVFHRTIDDDSVAEHGLWQIGQFLQTVWRQATVDRIADSWVYGSPQNKRGGKDDVKRVSFVTFEQGLRVAQKISIRSAVYDFETILPIRAIEIDFPVPMNPRYKVVASDELDDPFTTFEFWFPGFDFHIGDLMIWDPPPIPQFSACGDNWDRFVGLSDWGVASGMNGGAWVETANNNNPSPMLLQVQGSNGVIRGFPGSDGNNAIRVEIPTAWTSLPIHVRIKARIVDRQSQWEWRTFNTNVATGTSPTIGMSALIDEAGNLNTQVFTTEQLSGGPAAGGSLPVITNFAAQSFYIAVIVTADTIQGKCWPVGLPEPSTWTTFTNGSMDMTSHVSAINAVEIHAQTGTDAYLPDVERFFYFDEMAFLAGSNCGGVPGIGNWFGNHDVTETDTPPGYPSGFFYYQTPFLWAPNTERVWLDQRILRRGVDYVPYPLAGYIAIDDSIDVAGKNIRVNFAATGVNFGQFA